MEAIIINIKVEKEKENKEENKNQLKENSPPSMFSA